MSGPTTTRGPDVEHRWPGERDWSAFELLPIAVTVLDRDLRCRYANAAAVRWLGRDDAGEVLGRAGGRLLPAALWRAGLPYARAALAGSPQRVLLAQAGPGGRTVPLQADYTPHLVGTRVVGVVWSLTEVTGPVDGRQTRQPARGLIHGALDSAVAPPPVPWTAADPTADVIPRGSGGEAGAAIAELVAANVGDVIATADAQGRLAWLSASSAAVTGWAGADLVGRSIFELVHPDDEPALRARWAEQVTGVPLVGVEYRCGRPDGTYQWVETRIRPLTGPGGLFGGSVLSIRDVDERHRLQGQLTETLETVELGFTAAPIGQALVAADGRWLKVNPALSAIAGRTQAQLLAGTFQDITHPDDLDADLDLAGQLLRGERAGYQMEKRYLRPDGAEVWVLLHVAAARRADGSFRFFIVQVQDISRRRADAAALQHRADHDPLTELWNRRRLTEELTRCLHPGRRTSDRPVLLVCDLDGFKAINDTAGHAAGDAHLRAVAAALRDSVRAGDGCARLGGDEFAVLLPDADPATAAAIAGRIADRVAALGRGTISISIGTAAPRPDADVDGWLRDADAAMYRIKPGRRSHRIDTHGTGSRP